MEKITGDAALGTSRRLRPYVNDIGGSCGLDDLEVSGVGLQIPDGLGYEDWASVGEQLSGVVDSSCWWLGDWLVYGKRHYSDRYQQAIRMAGLRYQTLRNYAWVARRFPHNVRRSGLSFQHHAEVASLAIDARDWLLNQAELLSWTTKQLRHQVRADDANGIPAARETAAIPRVGVSTRRSELWQKAADTCGEDFDEWVATCLDDAAKAVLGTNEHPPDTTGSQ